MYQKFVVSVPADHRRRNQSHRRKTCRLACREYTLHGVTVRTGLLDDPTLAEHGFSDLKLRLDKADRVSALAKQ